MNASTFAPSRLGVERSLVQIQSPRLAEGPFAKVERVRSAVDVDIFDAIVVDRGRWRGRHRYVDADQVHEIFEKGVELTISSEEADRLPEAHLTTPVLRIDEAGSGGLAVTLKSTAIGE